jgi:hypothetical protein
MKIEQFGRKEQKRVAVRIIYILYREYNISHYFNRSIKQTSLTGLKKNVHYAYEAKEVLVSGNKVAKFRAI